MTDRWLRHEPAFVRWAVAEGVSMVGTAVSTVVLPLVVFDLTGSVALTGSLFAVRVVPYLLFGVIAGPIADLRDRRRLIIGGNIVEGVLIATVPLAHVLGILTVGQVFVVGLLSATAFVFSDAAVFGAVPALVGPERLSAANGLLATMASAAEITGPIAGGLLVAGLGPANAIWIDAVSFILAAVIQSTIRSSFRSGVVPVAPIRMRAQVARAIRFVRSHRTVAVLLGVGFGNSLAFGAVLGLLVPFAVTELGLDDDDARIGILYAATGAGALVSGLAFSRLFSTERVRLLTPTTLFIAAFVASGLALTSAWAVAALLLVAFSLAISTTINVGITYRQLAAPDDLRSSVNVLGRMIAWGGQPFGAAAGAVLAGASSVAVTYAVAAAVMAVSGASAMTLLHSTAIELGTSTLDHDDRVTGADSSG